MTKVTSCCSGFPPASNLDYSMPNTQHQQQLPMTVDLVPSEEHGVKDAPTQWSDGQDRLVANATVYHQHHGDQPTSSSCKFSTILDTVEQPFTRRVTIGTEPVPLETGWVVQAGYVLIENRTGQHPEVNPTQEERRAVASAIVRVAVGSDRGWLIQPNRFMLAEVEDASLVTLQCLQGTALVYLSVFSK